MHACTCICMPPVRPSGCSRAVTPRVYLAVHTMCHIVPHSAAAAAGLQGECLQLWGDAEVALLQEAPDEALSQQLQQQVQQRAAGLYQSSVQAYQQVGCWVVPAPAAAAAAIACAVAVASYCRVAVRRL
jgi:hypothetical protein